MRGVAILASALAAGALLSGCSASNPTVQPVASAPYSTSASSAAAAESVWNAYLEAYVDLLSDKSVPFSLIRPYVSSGEYSFVVKDVKALRSKNAHLVGTVDSRNFSWNAAQGGSLVCVINGSSRFVNASGNDVTPENRQAEATLLVRYSKENGKLVIDGDESWDEKSVC